MGHSKPHLGTLIAAILAVSLLVVPPFVLACYLGKRWYVFAEWKEAFGGERNDRAGKGRRSGIQDVEQGNTTQIQHACK